MLSYFSIILSDDTQLQTYVTTWSVKFFIPTCVLSLQSLFYCHAVFVEEYQPKKTNDSRNPCRPELSNLSLRHGDSNSAGATAID